MMPNVSMTFQNQFCSEYSRNNRKSGQKSLRCFPACLTNGHSNSGFCGQPVRLTAVFSGKLQDEVESELVFATEVHKFGDEGTIESKYKLSMICSSTFSSSSSYSDEQYTDFRASDDFPGWFGVSDTSTYDPASNLTKVQIYFNKGRHSWDYDWKSNRWSGPETSHVITCYMFRAKDPYLHLLSKVGSTPFIISCTHKHPIPHSVVKALTHLKSPTSKRRRVDASTNKSSKRLVSLSSSQASSQASCHAVVNGGHQAKITQEIARSTKYDDNEEKGNETISEVDPDSGVEVEEAGLGGSMSLLDRSCYIFDIKRRLENAGYDLRDYNL